jgi:hypothetical protein
VFNWKADDLGLEMAFHVRIQDGSIVIDCDVNKFEKSAHLAPLFMRAHDIARASVGLAAFATGDGLTVVLDTFTDPAGSTAPLSAQLPSLAMLATAARPGTRDFDKILEIVLAEPALFMALRDLIEAITSPQRAAVNCARAIRALRHFFEPPGGSAEARWLAIREKLQISRSYMREITQPSRTPGHADRPEIPGAVTKDVIDRAWIVMNRFLEFLKRDGQPLPLSEFPLLV